MPLPQRSIHLWQTKSGLDETCFAFGVDRQRDKVYRYLMFVREEIAPGIVQDGPIVRRIARLGDVQRSVAFGT